MLFREKIGKEHVSRPIGTGVPVERPGINGILPGNNPKRLLECRRINKKIDNIDKILS
jgi:hypothetical protein